MNQVLSLVVAISFVASGFAEAAVVAKKKSKKVKPKTSASQKLSPEQIKQANKAAAAAVDVAQKPQAQATQVVPVSAPQAAPAAAVTTAKVATPEAPKAKTGLGFSWLSINSFSNKKIQGGKENELVEVQAWEQPTLKYRFTENLSLSATPQFFHTWFGSAEQTREGDLGLKPGQLEQTKAFNMGDLSLKLTRSKIFDLSGFKLNGALGFLVPTSELSQKNETMGVSTLTLELSKSVGKFDFKYTGLGYLYHQAFNTSRLISAKGLPQQNRSLRHWQLLDVGYNFTEKLSVTAEFGTKVTYTYADADTNRAAGMSVVRIADIGATYAFSKHFSLTLGFTEEGNFEDIYAPFDIRNKADGGDFYFAANFII